MVQPDWQPLADFLAESIGYILRPDKFYLLDHKVTRLLDELADGTVAGLIRRMRADPLVWQQVVNKVTINESHFFRGAQLWLDMEQVIVPHLLEQLRGRLRILIAACSRGQEVYTLAMTLQKLLQAGRHFDYQITALDLDTEVLAYAEAGIYGGLEVSRGLPPAMKTAYFSQTPDGRFAVGPVLKRNVEFLPRNLIAPLKLNGDYHLVLCRNVLIYFDEQEKRRVLDRIAAHTARPGYLLLGGSETLVGELNHWTMTRLGGTTVYRRD